MKLTGVDYLNIFVALEFTIQRHRKDTDFTVKLKETSNKIHPLAFSEFYDGGVIKKNYEHLLHVVKSLNLK